MGGSEATLNSGDAIAVGATQAGKAAIACTAGEVAVVTGGQTQTLAQGQSASVAAPVLAQAPAAPAAPVVPARPAAPTAQPATPAQPVIPGQAAPAQTTTETAPEEISAAEPAAETTTLPPPNPAQECSSTTSPSAPC